MILRLHDKNNPTRLVLVNAEEISTIETYIDGSSVLSMKNGTVHNAQETPEDVLRMMEEK